MSTPPASLLTEPFSLHVPVGTATLYQQRIAEIPEGRRTSWRYHRITPEDSLASVAHTYHVSVEQLATANQMHADDTLDNVEALVIPLPLSSSPASHAEVYRTRKGDSLVKIADRFGVSLDDLHRWNHLTGTTVATGQRIRVTEPAHVAARTTNRSHTSGQNDTSAKTNKAHSKRSAKEKAPAKSAANKRKEPAVTAKKAAPASHASSSPKNSESRQKGTSKKKVQK
jgi:membrane-bound lytic murein transglycosylase D